MWTAVIVVSILHPEGSQLGGSAGGVSSERDIVALVGTHCLHVHCQLVNRSATPDGDQPDDSDHGGENYLLTTLLLLHLTITIYIRKEKYGCRQELFFIDCLK